MVKKDVNWLHLIFYCYSRRNYPIETNLQDIFSEKIKFSHFSPMMIGIFTSYMELYPLGRTIKPIVDTFLLSLINRILMNIRFYNYN